MILDLKTILVCDFILTAFLGLALVFYRASHKTYPGVGLWVAGTLMAALGFAAVLARGAVPLWLSILFTNGGFLLAGLFRLDGASRFLVGRNLPLYFYGIAASVLAGCMYFHFLDDDIVLRNLIFSVGILLVALVFACLLVWYSPGKQRTVCYFAAGMCVVFGTVILLRAVLWLMTPGEGLFDPDGFHVAFFLFVIVYEIWWGLAILMMNSQRMEAELMETQEHLTETVAGLEKAISEVKTLSGLLPICASCKKIRDDKGYWNQIEAYLSSRTDARFSHSICPACEKKLYPELNEA